MIGAGYRLNYHLNGGEVVPDHHDDGRTDEENAGQNPKAQILKKFKTINSLFLGHYCAYQACFAQRYVAKHFGVLKVFPYDIYL